MGSVSVVRSERGKFRLLRVVSELHIRINRNTNITSIFNNITNLITVLNPFFQNFFNLDTF